MPRPSAPDDPVRAIRRVSPSASRPDFAVVRAALDSLPSFARRQPRPGRGRLPLLYRKMFVPYRSSRQNAPELHHHARCPNIVAPLFNYAQGDIEKITGSERGEGSLSSSLQILRYAQDDKLTFLTKP